MIHLKSNAIQFAVVREDSDVEIEIFKRFKIKRPLLIGSGGCTALNLASAFPDLKISLLEPNKAQIALIKKKIKSVMGNSRKDLFSFFGVTLNTTIQENLIECGNFESLFRQFRSFLFEFVVSETQMLKLLNAQNNERWNIIFKHPYWSVAFDLFFSDAILRTMFGEAAIQHAPKNSYPVYFKTVIEQGLKRHDSKYNYFLHHILLGHYIDRRNSLPLYLNKPPKNVDVRFINKMAEDVPSYIDYDFVGLSNIFDWSSESHVAHIAKKLDTELRPNSLVCFRQLNNQKSFINFFGKGFEWKTRLSKNLQTKDKSLFYQSIHIGVKK